ncbi:MAG: T9SS C-terminal target domain-containing protein [Calditrichaeota bacterium]|nr:MAG: T9SS C-terminal target domain-containing protein [Calditrichota bacterium]
MPPGRALSIGKGSVLKFYTMGGIENEGQLYIDSSVLTSWEDDEHGGDTDNKFQPNPILSNWMAHGSGIFIDSGATAEITRTLIRYPRSGIHSFGGLTLDSVTIEDSWYSGVVLRGSGGYDYDISNTTIKGITRSDPYSAAVYFENRTGYHQNLRLNKVELLNNEGDGIEVFYLGDNFTNIELEDCHIANNTGYGIVFPVDHGLESIEILHSKFIGNGYAAIRGLDNFGSGIPIRIDNNVLIGNGLNQFDTYPYGIHLSGGTAKIVGNTVIDNGEIGILVGGLDNIEQCVLANNLIVGHTDYGLFKGDDGAPVVAGNNFWNNGSATEELRYEGPDGRIYTVENLQALGGDFSTNINMAPGLVPEIIGAIDTLAYDSQTGLSKLVDESASFPSNQTLVDFAICPDTTNPRWYPILHVSGDTLILMGDIRDYADTNSTYRILNYHLSEASLLIDAGFTTQTQEMFDIDGEARILDGDENGSMLVDIGADEFNGEADPSPIRVLQPGSDKWVVAYGTFNIEWQVPDSVTSVDIDYSTSYNPNQPDIGWNTIASGADATSNYYTWTIPEYETSAECYVRVKSTAHPDLFDLSAPFKIKHLGLTRMRNDSLITYSHLDDSWQFANEEADMWPASAWPDYINEPDSYTSLPYPDEFFNLGAANWDYPSWPTFVEAFGYDACYFNYWPTPQYKPSALFRWAAIKDAWGGSCFGLAVTALMAFQDAAGFAARPEIGPFTNLNSLTMTDLRRNLISRYYTYQDGQKNIDHTTIAETKTPNETLAEVRSMFCELEASSSIRNITICDTSSVNNEGCHTVTPYSLFRSVSGLWYLTVYDSNEPTLPLDIYFDTVGNNWEYPDLNWTGDKLCYLEDPLSNYTGLAEISESAQEAPPVLMAEKSPGYIEIFWNDHDSVRFDLGIGAIGQYLDSAFNSIPGARPIRPKVAGAGSPIGYFLPEGNWSCQMTGAAEDYAHLTVFDDDVIIAYRRDGVGPTDVEQIDIRGGDELHLINPDGTVRTCEIDLVLVEPDRERLLALDNLLQPPDDSVNLELTPANGLRVANFGAASSYDLVIRDLGGPEIREFMHSGINVGANSEQHLVPNWDNVSEAQLMVIVDNGIDGIVDDTIYLSNGSPLDVEDEQGALLPYRFELSQNYPNPFNPVTTIEYSLPRRSHVMIEIYNVLGQKVRTLVNREESAGLYTITWNGKDSGGEAVSTGMYFYRFQADDHIETKKMLLLK